MCCLPRVLPPFGPVNFTVPEFDVLCEVDTSLLLANPRVELFSKVWERPIERVWDATPSFPTVNSAETETVVDEVKLSSVLSSMLLVSVKVFDFENCAS